MIKGFISLIISVLLIGCSNNECGKVKDPSSPFNTAIRALVNNNQDLAVNLLDSGISPNQQNECGSSLLHISIIVGNKELALRLIQMGGKSNLPNWQNETPVFMAANWSRNEILEKLLKNKGNPNHQVNTTSAFNTPLLIAATNGNKRGVQLLLEHGANPRLANSNGKTASDIAKNDGYNEIVELLKNKKP